jgi:hypothetical protein
MLSRLRRFFQAADDREGVLLHGTAALICIGFVLWLVFAWTNYGEKYAQAMDGWRLGGKHMVELTLVGEDRTNLACASDAEQGGVRCEFAANNKPRPEAVGEAQRLSPYKTVNGVLLLGAGLWTAPDLEQPPRGRFTVVCNFHILGVTRIAAVRWQKSGQLTRVKETLPFGSLESCVIPR